jgi:hypothetical protein
MCKTIAEFNRRYFPQATAKREELTKQAKESNKCPLCHHDIRCVLEFTNGEVAFIHSREYVNKGHYKILACCI